MARDPVVRPGFNMSAVVRLSGVGAHTLRAWERRYHAVSPARTLGGQRSYRLEDIDRLKLLRTLVEQGHSISRLAPLPDSGLRKLVDPRPHEFTPPPAPAPRSFDLSPLLMTLHDPTPERTEREITRARLELPLRAFVLEAVSPWLSEVGQRVAAGSLSIAEEHRLSSILRSHLGELLTLARRAYDPGRKSARSRLIFSTRPGDLHEFGILLAALLAAQQGHAIQYLGPNLPASEFARAANIFGASIAVIGASPLALEKPRALSAYLEELSRSLPATCSIWVGGTLAAEPLNETTARRPRHRIRSIASLREFDAQIASL